MLDFVVIPVLALLFATAVSVALIRNLWAAVMFTGIYSFLGASWMLILDAPDVAFTEAAVGAGVATILMLATLALVPQKGAKSRSLSSADFETKPPTRSRVLGSIAVVAGTGAMLIYGTLDMPSFGDKNAAVQVYPNPSFVEKSQTEMGEHGLPNVVTAVLASYRGYDTLGETAVIFTAGVAVLLILRKTVASDSLAVDHSSAGRADR